MRKISLLFDWKKKMTKEHFSNAQTSSALVLHVGIDWIIQLIKGQS